MKNRYRYTMTATGKNWFEYRIFRNADNALIASGESRGRDATRQCCEGDIARMERADLQNASLPLAA